MMEQSERPRTQGQRPLRFVRSMYLKRQLPMATGPSAVDLSTASYPTIATPSAAATPSDAAPHNPASAIPRSAKTDSFDGSSTANLPRARGTCGKKLPLWVTTKLI